MAVSHADLQSQVDKFTEHTDDVRAKKDDVYDTFDSTISKIRWGGHIGSGLNPFGHLAVEELIDELEGKRAQLAPLFTQVFDKLDEIKDGLLAPFEFLDYAADWRSKAGAGLINAHNSWSDTGLEGYWSGVAASRYAAASEQQGTAMETASAMAETMATELEKLADAGWEFTKTIVEALVEYLAAIAAAIAKLATVVEAPWGASDIIDCVADLASFLVTTITATIDLLRQQKMSTDTLRNLATAQQGLPGNTWPKATTGTYSDATVLDGTNSWQVPSDVTPVG